MFGIFKTIHDAYVFNNYTAPFLNSMQSMLLPEPEIPEEENKQKKRSKRKKRKKKKK